jgi:benzoate/toluate 1,2-dioxygenase beta subunit
MSKKKRLRRIEQFLYLEAAYLDNPDLEAWLNLYTEDGTYWMPAIPGQEDPLNHVSLFYDDRVLMEIRKRNFVHPRAASKDYAVRSSHIIANVQVEEYDKNSGDCVVTSNFHCIMFYRDEQTVYAGRYRHDLAKTEDGYRIRQKRVDLINCDAPLGSIIIYI